MKRTVLPFKATRLNSNAWSVAVSGFSGDDDAKNSMAARAGGRGELGARAGEAAFDA